MKQDQPQKGLKYILSRFIKPVIISSIVLVIMLPLIYKRPMRAASNRAKSAAGIILGAGVVGGIAGGIGGAKWLPLGFGVGGLAGGLLVRAIRKRRQRKNAAMQHAAHPSRQRRTHRDYQSMSNAPGKLNNSYAPYRHIRQKRNHETY